MFILYKTVFAWWPVTATFEERRILANPWRQRKYTPIPGKRVWWRYVQAIGPPVTRDMGDAVPTHYALPLD